MLKHTYLNATQKQKVRDFLLAKFKFEHVVGLAGPDINQYIDRLASEGCKEFEIYENDSQTFMSQVFKINKPVHMIHGDILSADADKDNTLYDLDFCRTVSYLGPHIRKFNKNFIMTFSMRIKGGTNATIKTFFECRDEIIFFKRQFDSPVNHTEYITNKGKYLFTIYRDTSPMCCFAKIY
tara:strand:- start:2565 stop:3107 length:543 start_codon:yes stop_codon:yes gene_type:complete